MWNHTFVGQSILKNSATERAFVPFTKQEFFTIPSQLFSFLQTIVCNMGFICVLESHYYIQWVDDISQEKKEEKKNSKHFQHQHYFCFRNTNEKWCDNTIDHRVLKLLPFIEIYAKAREIDKRKFRSTIETTRVVIANGTPMVYDDV